jgi:hypothetical protein
MANSYSGGDRRPEKTSAIPKTGWQLTAPMSMDLHYLMSALQRATDLDLLRLRTAIDHLLHSPARILAAPTLPAAMR